MPTVLDFDWMPSALIFGPMFYTSGNLSYGRQVNSFGDPHFITEMTLPEITEKRRRELFWKCANTENKAIVNAYDSRVSYPQWWKNLVPKNQLESVIPDITVKAMDRENKTITISGATDDVIIGDDPIAFTYNNVRYYFRAAIESLKLDGTDQVLPVYLRPRLTIAGLNIVVDRVKPTHRFVFDFAPMFKEARTNSDGFTPITVQGVEYYGSYDAG